MKVRLRFNILTARKMGAEKPQKGCPENASRATKEASRSAFEASARMKRAETCIDTRAKLLAQFNKAFPAQ